MLTAAAMSIFCLKRTQVNFTLAVKNISPPYHSTIPLFHMQPTAAPSLTSCSHNSTCSYLTVFPLLSALTVYIWLHYSRSCSCCVWLRAVSSCSCSSSCALLELHCICCCVLCRAAASLHLVASALSASALSASASFIGYAVSPHQSPCHLPVSLYITQLMFVCAL